MTWGKSPPDTCSATSGFEFLFANICGRRRVYRRSPWLAAVPPAPCESPPCREHLVGACRPWAQYFISGVWVNMTQRLVVKGCKQHRAGGITRAFRASRQFFRSMFANAWNKAREAAASVKEGVADAATKAKEAAMGPQREIATPTTIVCDESLPDSEIRVNLQKKLEELGERQRPSIRPVLFRLLPPFA